jgi:hypothetical protein
VYLFMGFACEWMSAVSSGVSRPNLKTPTVQAKDQVIITRSRAPCGRSYTLAVLVRQAPPVGQVLPAHCFDRVHRAGRARNTTLGKSVQGFSQRSSSEASESGLAPNGPATYHTLLDRHADFCDIGRVRLTITRRSIGSEPVPGPSLTRSR